MTASRVPRARRGVRLLKRLMLVAVVTVPACAVVAVYLAFVRQKTSADSARSVSRTCER